MQRTKRELAEEALALGDKLGVSVSVDRLNHAKLTELVESLRERAAGVDSPQTPEPTGPPSPSPEAPDAAQRPADPAPPAPAALGRPTSTSWDTAAAITTHRGVLDVGEPVTADDIPDGEDGLLRLEKKGLVRRVASETGKSPAEARREPPLRLVGTTTGIRRVS